ncbi:hypothetical protein Tco_1379158 [Tanacetum coccineum]
MDLNQSDEERKNFSNVDDETDVYFMMQAYEYNQLLQQQQTRPRFTHNPIYRERDDAKTCLLHDYFTEDSLIVYTRMKKLSEIMAEEIWVAGANNDINVLDNSQLFNDFPDDIAPIAPLRFEESVKNRFGPSKYEDLHGALSKLLQLGTVEDYQREFEKLMNRVTDIPESLLIFFYISGLKLNLQHELLVSKQTTLGDASSLARITEARLKDQSSMASVTTAKPFPNIGNQTHLGGTSPVVSTPILPLLPNPYTNPKPLAIKWISSMERQERLNKGLCFNCDNRWVRGHKCSGKFLLLMADGDDDMGDVATAGGDDAVKSGYISILNSLIGHGIPRSLQLWGMIGTTNVHVLIDNGSMHNFIRPDVVERKCLPIQPTKVFKVYIGSGETLMCGSDASLRMKKINLHQMQALLDQDEVYRVYEIRSLAKAADVKEMRPATWLWRMLSLRPCLKGLIHYSSSFGALGGYATIATPLTDLLRKDGFKWGLQKASAFEELNQRLSTTLVLSLPYFNEVFLVKSDASANGIGADEETVSATFMALSQLVLGILADLKEENTFLGNVEVGGGRDGLMRCLKKNLVEARNRMEVKVNHNRRDVEFNVRDKVLVKLQPYRQITLAKCLLNKLAKRFNGPYEIVKRIGKVTYQLALPSTSKIHSVFHVSILKLFSGNGEEAVTELPEEFQERRPLEKSMAISTWEWMSDFKDTYPSYNLEDKVISEEGENVTPMVDGLSHGKQTKKAPGCQKEFVMG